MKHSEDHMSQLALVNLGIEQEELGRFAEEKTQDVGVF